MPRPSYGPKTQERCLALFAAIVRYANGELDADDRTLDRLQRQVQTQWQDDRRVVVRTKVRHLEELTALGGMRLTAAQIKEALARLGDYVGILEDNRPTAGGSEYWHFTLQLLASRWDWAANQGRFGEVWQARRSQAGAMGSLSDGVGLQATPIEPGLPSLASPPALSPSLASPSAPLSTAPLSTAPLPSLSSLTAPLSTAPLPSLTSPSAPLSTAPLPSLASPPALSPSLALPSAPLSTAPLSPPPLLTQLTPDLCRSSLRLQRAYRLSFHPGSLPAMSLPAMALPATIDRPTAPAALESCKMDAPEAAFPKVRSPKVQEMNAQEINAQEINAQEIYVPLGLEEWQGGEPGWGEGDAVAQQWSVAEWWGEVLVARRVAIVGETGSGKTMLLQQLAEVLLARGYLPLWIAVADLQGRRLEDYVLQEWLQQATQRWQVAEALRADVAAQVAAGRVWLLLDGVDEAGEGGTGLGAVGRSLRGWLAPAPVVLTCRLSQWDSGFNPLQGFRVFQNLGLRPGGRSGAGGDRQGGDRQGSDPRGGDRPGSDRQNRDPRGGDRDGAGSAQQADFIGLWFEAIQQPELGQRLLQELQVPHQRHLQDLVQSPLYLALLCRLWSLTQGQLPPTKASLYQRWVEALYTWQQDRCPTSLQQRWQLNRALGTVAIAALRQPQQPYRLSQTLVQGEIAPHLDRLSLALQLGWLTPIGPASPTLEPCYRFYHPTFQDYFAAQAIHDAQFWEAQLGLGETDFSARLREPWRSVLLLWMGRGEVPEAAKEEVLRGLQQCPGDCGGFYGVQGLALAAIALGEFPSRAQGGAILQPLLQWRFGPQPPPVIPSLFRRQLASSALLKTDRSLAIAALEDFVQRTPDPFSRWNAAYTLGRVLEEGNATAIAALTDLLDEIRGVALQIKLCNSLGKIQPGSARAIATLEALLNQNLPPNLHRKAAYTLGKMAPDATAAIAVLVGLIDSHGLHTTLGRQAWANLQTLAPEHPGVQRRSVDAAAALGVPLGAGLDLGLDLEPETIASSCSDRSRSSSRKVSRASSRASSRPLSPPPPPHQFQASLEQRLSQAQHPTHRHRLAAKLGCLQPGHPAAIAALTHLLTLSLEPGFYRRIGADLGQILLPEQLPALVTDLASHHCRSDLVGPQFQAIDLLLGNASQSLSYEQFQQAWGRSSAPTAP